MEKISTTDKGIQEILTSIGLPINFFNELLEKDDWSFVIMLHALIEAICTRLMLYHFQEKKLEKIFSRLELSNPTIGKVAFLKELGLISEENRKFIISLSELRNKFVHDVQNYNIDLKKMINSFDKNQIKSFATSFSPYESMNRRIFESDLFKKHFDNDSKLIDMKKQSSITNIISRANENPKFHIWLGAYNFLVTTSDMFGYSDFIQWMKARALLDINE